MRIIRSDEVHHIIQFGPDRAFSFRAEPVAVFDHHFVFFRDLFRDLTYRFHRLLVVISFGIFLSEFFSKDEFHRIQRILVIGIQNRLSAVFFRQQAADTAPVAHQGNVLPLFQVFLRKQGIDLCKLSRIPEIYTVCRIRRKSHGLQKPRHPDIRTDGIDLLSRFVLCRLHRNVPVFFHPFQQIQICRLRNVNDHPGCIHASFFCFIAVHSAVDQRLTIIHGYHLSHVSAYTDVPRVRSARIRKRLQPDTSRRRIVHIRTYGKAEDRIYIPLFIQFTAQFQKLFNVLYALDLCDRREHIRNVLIVHKFSAAGSLQYLVIGIVDQLLVTARRIRIPVTVYDLFNDPVHLIIHQILHCLKRTIAAFMFVKIQSHQILCIDIAVEVILRPDRCRVQNCFFLRFLPHIVRHFRNFRSAAR